MWAAVIEVEPPAGFGQRMKVARTVRYAGVLAVWIGLALIRPRLAAQIWRERRRGPVKSWPSGLTEASQRQVLRNRR